MHELEWCFWMVLWFDYSAAIMFPGYAYENDDGDGDAHDDDNGHDHGDDHDDGPDSDDDADDDDVADDD